MKLSGSTSGVGIVQKPAKKPAQKQPRWRFRQSAAGVSLILHLTAVAVFSLTSLELPPASEEPVELHTRWEEGTVTIVDTVLPTPMEESFHDRKAPPLAHLAMPFVNSTPGDLSDVLNEMPGGSPASPSDLATEAGASGIGNGTGDGQGDGNGGGGGGFFGLRKPGDRIVYVVDCSRSMNHPHPGPAKTRIARVKYELLNSIGALETTQQFFIIFFNQNAIPMPADRLMDATNSAKQRYLRWMAQARADGETDPRMALLMAIRLNPDIVYFLTDGDFSRKIVKDVTAVNSGKVVIHTIGFGDNRGEDTLKLMAEQSGGTYSFIPAEEEGAKTSSKSSTVSRR